MRMTGPFNMTTNDTGLYFIQEGEGGPIKIGRYSGNIKVRISALQTGNPRELRLIHDDMRCDFVNEAVVHYCLASHRIRGEWFRPCDDVLSAISFFKTIPDRASLFAALKRLYKSPLPHEIYVNKRNRIPKIIWIEERIRQAESSLITSKNEAQRFVALAVIAEYQMMLNSHADQ